MVRTVWRVVKESTYNLKKRLVSEAPFFLRTRFFYSAQLKIIPLLFQIPFFLFNTRLHTNGRKISRNTLCNWYISLVDTFRPECTKRGSINLTFFKRRRRKFLLFLQLYNVYDLFNDIIPNWMGSQWTQTCYMQKKVEQEDVVSFGKWEKRGEVCSRKKNSAILLI